jgi:peptidoglycan/xylan/chitin deacetylase (PgdA/CDA1 family)
MAQGDEAGPVADGGGDQLDGGQRAALTRRMLLSAGGITLLAGCSAPVARLAASAQAKPVHTHGTGTKPSAARHPAGGSAKHTAGHRAIAREPVFYVEDGSKAIALTIDDGPSAIYTPQVLRLLAKYRVTAMFSMIGIEVDALPGMARDVVAAGHEIANHTWRHLDLGVLPPSAVVSEMDRATDAIHRATSVVPRRFRAPYGVWSPTVFRRCADMDMTPVDWSVDPRDWSLPGVSSIVRDIMRTTHPGSIILEHDGGGDRSETVAALKIVIPRLLDAGYHFVTP